MKEEKERIQIKKETRIILLCLMGGVANGDQYDDDGWGGRDVMRIDNSMRWGVC